MKELFVGDWESKRTLKLCLISSITRPPHETAYVNSPYLSNPAPGIPRAASATDAPYLKLNIQPSSLLCPACLFLQRVWIGNWRADLNLNVQNSFITIYSLCTPRIASLLHSVHVIRPADRLTAIKWHGGAGGGGGGISIDSSKEVRMAWNQNSWFPEIQFKFLFTHNIPSYIGNISSQIRSWNLPIVSGYFDA